MFLIVGLGNPGQKYEKTRHNIGFWAADEIAAAFGFSAFVLQSKFNAQISKSEIAGKKVILAKPQTFMNLSGGAVKKIIKNLKLEIRNLIVIHDDLDLPLGKIKISISRGSAGHKGVESIIKELGTKGFVRLRLGICPETEKPENPEGFVLQKFTKDEEKIANEVIKKTCEAIEFFIKEGLERAMSKYNE